MKELSRYINFFFWCYLVFLGFFVVGLYIEFDRVTIPTMTCFVTLIAVIYPFNEYRRMSEEPQIFEWHLRQLSEGMFYAAVVGFSFFVFIINAILDSEHLTFLTEMAHLHRLNLLFILAMSLLLVVMVWLARKIQETHRDGIKQLFQSSSMNVLQDVDSLILLPSDHGPHASTITMAFHQVN